MNFVASTPAGDRSRAPAVPLQAGRDQRPTGTIHSAFFSNLPFTTTIEEFTTFASQYGEIANVYSLIPRKGIAFVTYFDLRHAQRAVAEANEQLLGGRPVRTNYAHKSAFANRDPRKTCSAVLVQSLTIPSRLRLIDLQASFAQFGELREVNQLTSPGNFCVKFYDFRPAQRVVSLGRIPIGDELLCVDFKIDADDGNELKEQPQQAQMPPQVQPLETEAVAALLQLKEALAKRKSK
jgi:RNA recognition motif-containing protein